MTKTLLIALLAAAAFAGCTQPSGNAPASSSQAAAPAAEATPAAIATKAKGFTAGSLMSARTTYVFFDAQCPHCATLWEAAKPLQSQMKFVWIPVGVLNKASIAQGATILGAKDPVATMNEHESLLQARRGGITADTDLKDHQEAVNQNTELLRSFGVGSIPYVVGTHATTGEIVRIGGSMPTAALAARLGLTPPTPAEPAAAAAQ